MRQQATTEMGRVEVENGLEHLRMMPNLSCSLLGIPTVTQERKGGTLVW
jgi:hypothetical protein